MNNRKFPLPMKYWIFLGIAAMLAILLFANIFITDSWTGEKDFSEYSKREWLYFAIFLISEIVIGVSMALFAIKAGKLAQIRNTEESVHYCKSKFAGIKPGDYDYVWFDFDGDQRALVFFDGKTYRYYLQSFDRKAEQWNPMGTVSCHSTLDDVKKSLFFDCNFYCEENARLDEHGDEEFIEIR